MFVRLDEDKIRNHGRYEAYLSWFPPGVSFGTVFEVIPSYPTFSIGGEDRIPLRIKEGGATYFLRKSDVTAILTKRLEEWL